MAEPQEILELSGVRASALFGHRAGELNLTLNAGDLALIDARDTALAANFADLCCGLHPPAKGRVRFLRRDWSHQSPEIADALRGLIGRVLHTPGWFSCFDARANILLRQVHHTRTALETLSAEAAELAVHFGLPGLPTGPIAQLSDRDLTRAGFVRAFVGRPKLVILESPVRGLHVDMIAPLLNQIGEVRSNGGAAVWLTRSHRVWENAVFPATHRLRLDHLGLTEMRMAA
jgi:phospholipid/cholesterol/gamma-HCH transport system ATP-binding protein